MTLGEVLQKLQSIGVKMPESYWIYLRPADGHGKFTWRHLQLNDLPRHLVRLKYAQEYSHTTVTQYTCSIKWIVINGVKHNICELPSGWRISSGVKNKRFTLYFDTPYEPVKQFNTVTKQVSSSITIASLLGDMSTLVDRFAKLSVGPNKLAKVLSTVVTCNHLLLTELNTILNSEV